MDKFGIMWIEIETDLREEIKCIDGAFIDDVHPWGVNRILITTENAYRNICDLFKQKSINIPYLDSISFHINDYLWESTSIGDIFGHFMPYTQIEREEATDFFWDIYNKYKKENCLDKFNWMCELDNAIKIFVEDRVEKAFAKWKMEI